MIYAIDGIVPVIDPSAFVHPSAVLIGDVIIGPDCYVGPCASLRGDFGRLILGRGANVQDTCVLHGFPGTDTIIEENGHIGHGAILHGCRIGVGALVGMNAVIMDNAVIGEGAIVAACAFVKAGMIVPPRAMVAGMPAKVLREVNAQESEWKIMGTRTYQDLARRCHASLVEAEPLTAVEANRRRIVMPGVVPLAEARKAAQAGGENSDSR